MRLKERGIFHEEKHFLLFEGFQQRLKPFNVTNSLMRGRWNGVLKNAAKHRKGERRERTKCEPQETRMKLDAATLKSYLQMPFLHPSLLITKIEITL